MCICMWQDKAAIQTLTCANAVAYALDCPAACAAAIAVAAAWVLPLVNAEAIAVAYDEVAEGGGDVAGEDVDIAVAEADAS